MKKILAILLAMMLIVCFAACNTTEVETTDGETTGSKTEGTTATETETETETETDAVDPFEGMSVMSYEEYAAAELDAPVIVEAYVQATQSWWDNKITVYLQDEDGGYLAYELTCSEEDAANLVPGVKIRIKGFKTEWAGEVEIASGATFEFVEADAYIAEPIDLTAVLANEAELIKYQNRFATFTGLVIESITYKNDEPGDDIYVSVKQGENTFSFCVERYLTAPDTELYQAFAELEAGDVIDVDGFVYWYNGVNTHITAVRKLMSHDEYVAAELDSFVMVSGYVQATQSWWSDKITVYFQDQDGGYLAYELTCSEEDAAKLVPGTKIVVIGYKTEWAGEVEIAAGATFRFVEGADTYVAEPVDLTDILANEAELIKHQNEFASFKGLTVESVTYKNGEPGDDIYVNVKLGNNSYSFCVERYLTAPDTELYQAFATIKAGDVIDVEGFVYWYNGINTHITSVTVVTE